MKPLRLRPRLHLIILVGALFALLTVPSVQAQQGPVDFDNLEPSAGTPDSELEVTLFGSNFEVIEDFDVIIDGVDIFDRQIVSSDAIRLGIYILQDAPPGPKQVEIFYQADNTPFQAVLEDGFFIFEPEDMPFAAPVQLFAVDPPEGSPGEAFDIFLVGEGFAPADDFGVNVEGVEIIDLERESSEVIRANIFIPEDAPPGPRLVEVVIVRDGEPFGTGLEEGFQVLSAQQFPLNQPPNWVWPIIVVLFSGASFTVGRFLNLRAKILWQQQAKLQWQLQAKWSKPQKPTKACEWVCEKTASVSRDRWKVTRIMLTPLPVKGKTPPRRSVSGNVLDPLNRLVKNDNLPQEEKRRNLAGLLNALVAEINAWEQAGQSPASIRLDAALVGAVDIKFNLYHGRQTNKGLAWSHSLLEWKGKLNQPGGEHLGVLRGPTTGEANFAARVRAGLEECLLDLVDTAGSRL